MSADTFTETEELAYHADVDDLLSNPNTIKFAPVTIIAGASKLNRRCKLCEAPVRTGFPVVSMTVRTKKRGRRPWSVYWCVECAPFDVDRVRPLADRRLLAWAGRTIAEARDVASVPPAVWRALAELRERTCPATCNSPF